MQTESWQHVNSTPAPTPPQIVVPRPHQLAVTAREGTRHRLARGYSHGIMHMSCIPTNTKTGQLHGDTVLTFSIQGRQAAEPENPSPESNPRSDSVQTAAVSAGMGGDMMGGIT